MQIDIDRLLNLPNVRVSDFSFTDKDVFLSLTRQTKSEKCPTCGGQCSTVRSYTTRQVRDLDLLGRQTILTIPSRQFECGLCKRYFIEDIGFVQGNHGLTKRYEEYIYKMSKDICIQPHRRPGGLSQRRCVLGYCQCHPQALCPARSEPTAKPTTGKW